MNKKLFDLLKAELVGKSVYTTGNIKFKITGVMKGYEEIQKHFSTDEKIQLSALILFGKDEKDNQQALVVSNNRLIELVYFDEN
jgi:hypothetical protein